ncbi:MAG: hypothetical protein ACLRSW_10235 [Christensenellaceae bacterium]
MSVADRSIDPRIIESAKEEFLQKDFGCVLAGYLQTRVLRRALYKRFRAGRTFCALVESTVQGLESWCGKSCPCRRRLRTNSSKAWDMDRNTCSGGSTISTTATTKCACCSFSTDEIRELEHDGGGYGHATYAYYKEARRGLTKTDISSAACFRHTDGYLQPLIHGFSKQEAGRISNDVRLFDW